MPLNGEHGLAIERLSLKANFTWTFLGNVIYAASQWGMLVILAKISSPELVGSFALALAITAPIFMLTNLQLRAILATDAQESYTFGDYFGLRIATTGFAILSISAIVLFSTHDLATKTLVLALTLAKSAEAISDVVYGLLQKHERMDWIAKSMMIKGPISLIVLAIVTLLSGRVALGALAMALLWIVILWAYDLRRAGTLAVMSPRFSRSRLTSLIMLAFPLGVVMMLLSLNTSIPRYLLETYQGAAQLGYFAALSYVMMVGTTIVGALGQSASPRLARYYAEGRQRDFVGLLLRLCTIGGCIGIVGIVAAAMVGKPLLTWLYRPDYAQYTDILVWLMVVAAVLYVASFLGFGMTAARRFATQLPLFIIVSATLLVAGVLLIPTHGLKGAVWAMGISGLVQVIGAAIINGLAIRDLSKRQWFDGRAAA